MIPTQGSISINGHIMSPNQAMVSAYDRGFLFGDSIYEATLAKNGIPIFWSEHCHRLFRSAELIHLNITTPLSMMNRWVHELLRYRPYEQSYLRLVITRGTGAVNLAPPEHYANTVVIYNSPLNYPPEWFEQGVAFAVSGYQRNSLKALNPQAKTGNYLNNQLALQDSKRQGFHDALMLNEQGFVTEGTTNNFWMIKDGVVITPDQRHGLLLGITRQKIFSICEELKIPAQESHLTLDQILKADECFYTSATKGIVPITRVDQWKIGTGLPGALTQKLRAYYEIKVAEYIKDHTTTM